MNCKKYFQGKAIAGAFSAFAVASIVSAPAFAGGGPYVFLELEEGEVVEFYTDGAAIPSSVTGNIEVESSFGNLPDVESVTVNADGGADVDATLIDQYESRFGAALWSANVSAAPNANPFDTTITAIGSVPAYYGHDAYTVMDSVTITLQFLDTSEIDSNDDGDPIPDLDKVDTVLASGSTVTSTTSSGNLVVSDLSSAPGSVGTDDGFPFTLSGGQNAFLSVDVPAVSGTAVGGPYNNVVVMATIANSAEDLAGGGAPSAGITVPDGSTEQGVYVRLVVMTQLNIGDSYVVFTGDLSGLFDTDITLSLEIQDATATTTAGAFQFDATYDAMTNTFSATGGESWSEVPEPEVGVRADVVAGVITITLDKSGTVIGFTGDGGDSLLGGGSSSSSTCFIATAAYGTPMATEIDTLRAVRDTYMLNNVVGSAFVDTYYRLSPAVADKVAESPVLAAAVRAILTPFVLLGKLILVAPMALVGLMLAGAGLALTSRRARGQQS